MSDSHDQPPAALPVPSVRPVPAPAAPAAPPRNSLFGCLFTLSVLANVVGVLVFFLLCFGLIAVGLGLNTGSNGPSLTENFRSGNASSKNKIAIIDVSGPLMEGLMGFADKQIEQAAADKEVKAVVLRIDSPGGTITASDDLHRRLSELRWGKDLDKKNEKLPLVVSMGSMAASGGYYIAMPGKTIYAQRSTITGSIGVYASFPNISGLMDEHKVKMITIKQGEVKDSGSMFHPMTDKEQQVWQNMVNTAYNQFLDVVAEGRAGVLTKDELTERFTVEPVEAGPPPKPGQIVQAPGMTISRYRADGGIYTADKAKELKLIDAIGTLDDALADAAKQANLGTNDYKAIEYQRRLLFTEQFLGIRQQSSASVLDPGRLQNGLTPRLWLLAPGCEMSGVLASMDAPSPGDPSRR